MMGTAEMEEWDVAPAEVEAGVAGVKVQLQDSMHKILTQQFMGDLMQ